MSHTLPASIEECLNAFHRDRPTPDPEALDRMKDAKKLLPWKELETLARLNGQGLVVAGANLEQAAACVEVVALLCFHCGVVWGRLDSQ